MTIKKSLKLFVAGGILGCLSTPAHAIPIPAIDIGNLPTLTTQIVQYLKEQVQTQLQNKIGKMQQNAMGDASSMGALKGATKKAEETPVKDIDVPDTAKKIGLTADTLKDAEKTKQAIDKISDKADKMSADEKKECLVARGQLQKELAQQGLANALAVQKASADGEAMSNAKEAVNSSQDQMQLIGANTLVHKYIFTQMSTLTALQANALAQDVIKALCK